MNVRGVLASLSLADAALRKRCGNFAALSRKSDQTSCARFFFDSRVLLFLLFDVKTLSDVYTYICFEKKTLKINYFH